TNTSTPLTLSSGSLSTGGLDGNPPCPEQMLSFVAILATSSPMICSDFRYFNLGYLWSAWRLLIAKLL
ncbi:hypothetical protein ACR25A_003598, partial [Escherichia coli]